MPTKRSLIGRHSIGMRVVLITYYFPPDPAVGALRAAKVARAFSAAGHPVDVITARLPGETEPRRTEDPRIVVHPVTPIVSPREIVAWLKARRHTSRPKGDPANASGEDEWRPPTHVAGWKRLLFSLLWLPDDRQGFIFPAWRKARALMQRGAQLIYSTAPPFSPHLVGLALRFFSGLPWVMELRDPWAHNDVKPWWVRTRATDALDARLERLCLGHADLVVAVSEGIQKRLAAKLTTRDRSRVLLVRNGIEELAGPGRAVRRSGPIRIVYLGTMYYGRDPRPFLRGLATVCRKHRMGPDAVRVEFIGACRLIETISVAHEIERLRLTNIVHIQDWLPHAAAKAVMDEADVLLLLAQHQPDQVPNKLYEYLGARRPILAFADADGETDRMLRRAGGHYVVTGNDDTEVERTLEALLASPPTDCPETDEVLLKEWTTEVQMERLLAAVYG